ncbi:MAG: DNA gyrase subunit A, partial [Mycoplasmatales bacterium]
IVDEMSTSFLDYAMSVIVSRAIPDVRDGLKPVHRRILYAMSEIGNTADKPYKKSARIVGDVIGKYHPHGDTAVYEAMVRMSQDFSFRDMLVDGHGNFGSIDGDGAAAMRYTEARMSKIAMELLKDINKNTVDYQDNYDASETEPAVLPSRFPNMLVNGGSGIAVGMSTNIPPHNLGEVIDGIIAYIDDSNIDIKGLMQYIKGPDFPLGAQVLGSAGIEKAYTTGNGSIKVRAKYEVFEEKNGKNTIIVTEIPFQVNKASLVEKIADNIRQKRVEGITDLRDESDRDGIRIVLETKKGVTPEVIINNLFKYTQLETSFPANLLALVHGEPKVLNLKEIIEYYVEHQIEIITRKTKFDLEKAKNKIHILEGLQIAVDNIDDVIKLIKSSRTPEEARDKLALKYKITEVQSRAILDMKLQKLTGLEMDKLTEEINELRKIITELEAILASPEKINSIIKEDLEEIKAKYATPRRSEIIEGYFDSSINYEDLIEEQEVIVTLTEGGYAKRITSDNYRVQNRGGKGNKGIKLNEEDVVSHIEFSSTHSDIMFFTDKGKVYRARVHQIPEFSKNAKGFPLVNIIDLDPEEKITKILSVKEYRDDSSLMFITKQGIGKKTKIAEYERVNKNGKKALTLNEGDTVVSVFVVKDGNHILVSAKGGNSVHFEQSQVRNMGRTSRGVRIMKFKSAEDHIISADVVIGQENVLSISENGYGKQTPVKDYRVTNRGGSGVKNLKVTDKTGFVSVSKIINPDEMEDTDVLVITNNGQTIRVTATSFSQTGRNTQGVRIMKLNEGEKVSTIEFICDSHDKDEVIAINNDGQNIEANNEKTQEFINEQKDTDEYNYEGSNGEENE